MPYCWPCVAGGLLAFRCSLRTLMSAILRLPLFLPLLASSQRIESANCLIRTNDSTKLPFRVLHDFRLRERALLYLAQWCGSEAVTVLQIIAIQGLGRELNLRAANR